MTFKDPQTNEPVTLYVDDALRYYTYVLFNAFGITIDEFPLFSVEKVHKKTIPTLSSLEGLCRSDLELEAACQELRDAHHNLTTSRSISAFNTQATAIYEQCQSEWVLLANVHDMERRGALDLVIDAFYENKSVDLTPPGHTTCSSWLSSKNLPKYDLSAEQAQSLLDGIFQASTGYTLDTSKSLNNIHAALIAILLEFSSYTLKCVREINESAIIPLHGPSLRLGNIDGEASSLDTVVVNSSIVFADGFAAQTEVVESNTVDLCTSTQPNPAAAVVDLAQELLSDTALGTQQFATFPAHRLAMSYPGHNAVICDKYGFYGADLYVGLTETQKATLVDIYTNRDL